MTLYDTKLLRGHEISLCDIQERDIPYIVDYWHNSDDNYLHSMRVDKSKLISRDVTATKFIESIPKNRGDQSRITLVFKDGETVIAYTNVSLNADGVGYGHVHIIKNGYKQIGFVAEFFDTAIEIFREKFHVNSLRFQTNKENRRINRYLAKLGYEVAHTEYLENPDGMASPGWYHTYIAY